jgi:hypothetical protein
VGGRGGRTHLPSPGGSGHLSSSLYWYYHNKIGLLQKSKLLTGNRQHDLAENWQKLSSGDLEKLARRKKSTKQFFNGLFRGMPDITF